MTTAPRNILIICRTSPYGSSRAREAIDLILAGAVYEQEINVLFMADGVFLLLPQQQAKQIAQKSFSSMLAAFELYGVNHLYADSDALQARGLSTDHLTVSATLLSDRQIGNLIAAHDTVLSF